MTEKYSAKRRLGNMGEDVATQFILSKGFEIVERNYLKPWGEIDIIATKDGVYRFIEVKTVSRESLDDISRVMGDYRPEEMVHASKLKKVGRTAEMYINDRKIQADFQIDVIGVFLDTKNRRALCRIYEQVL